tara:strand:- start:156 stop:485 length:330 start_codon:yes stop_codon:yes gene_type:complete
MKKLILISAILLNVNGWADEWSAYVHPSSNESRYIGRFETKEDCQVKAKCYIEKANRGSLLDIIFANKIEQGSFECIVTEHKETENELKEAKKWIGKFIFGLTDKSCAL